MEMETSSNNAFFIHVSFILHFNEGTLAQGRNMLRITKKPGSMPSRLVSTRQTAASELHRIRPKATLSLEIESS